MRSVHRLAGVALALMLSTGCSQLQRIEQWKQDNLGLGLTGGLGCGLFGRDEPEYCEPFPCDPCPPVCEPSCGDLSGGFVPVDSLGGFVPAQSFEQIVTPPPYPGAIPAVPVQ